MDENALSIEETNRLRISLGLKPLKTTTAAAAAASDKGTASQPIHVPPPSKPAALTASSTRTKETGKYAILEGRGLADDDDEDADAAANWIQKHALKSTTTTAAAKSTIKKAGNAQAAATYTEEDLVGLKVSHDLSALEHELGDTILVLQDSHVLHSDAEDHGAVGKLVNVQLQAAHALKQSQKVKKGVQVGTGLAHYDQDEEEGFIVSNPKNLALDKAKRKHALLDESRKYESLDASMTADGLAKIGGGEDYLTKAEESELLSTTFKRSKKKNKKQKILAAKEDDGFEDLPLGQHAMQRMGGTRKSADSRTDEFMDDDLDLQLALSKSRKQALKKMTTTADIATTVLQENLNNDKNGSVDTDMDKGSGRLVLSETSEFVRNLGTTATVQPELSIPQATTVTLAPPVELPVPVSASRHEPEDMTTDLPDDVSMHSASASQSSPSDHEEERATVQEPLVNQGMAATLSLLRQKGSIRPKTAQEAAEEARLAQRHEWLLERYKESIRRENKDAKSDDDDGAAAGNMYDGTGETRDEIEKELLKFANYKPELNLDHVDEFGRTLTWKESWKQLCYRFHGNKPGKANTEKRLRKIARELKDKKSGYSGSGAGILGDEEALDEAKKGTGSAHAVLMVGTRNALPKHAPDSDDDDQYDVGVETRGSIKKEVAMSVTSMKPRIQEKKSSYAKPSTSVVVSTSIPQAAAAPAPSTKTSGVSTATPETSEQKSKFVPLQQISVPIAGAPVKLQPQQELRQKIQFGFKPLTKK